MYQLLRRAGQQAKENILANILRLLAIPKIEIRYPKNIVRILAIQLLKEVARLMHGWVHRLRFLILKRTRALVSCIFLGNNKNIIPSPCDNRLASFHGVSLHYNIPRLPLQKNHGSKAHQTHVNAVCVLINTCQCSLRFCIGIYP